MYRATAISTFARVGQVLADSVGSGTDVGASCAVMIDGEPVVDIRGGYLDERRIEPWQDQALRAPMRFGPGFGLNLAQSPWWFNQNVVAGEAGAVP